VTRSRLDLLAAVPAALAVVMLVVYVDVVHAQGSDPAPWVLAVLVLGGVAAAYGAVVRAPHRRVALVVAGVLLLGLGLLAVLTIGLPILLAGALCVGAALRGRGEAASRTTRS
jgi:hypothetical protein